MANLNPSSGSSSPDDRLEPQFDDIDLQRIFHSVVGAKLHISELPQAAAVCKFSTTGIQHTISEFERWIGSRDSPRAEHLLVLVKFNVFRAMVSNSDTLGYSLTTNCDDDALSLFNSPTTYSFSSLPKALQPTKLQREIPHHPWIDQLPFPAMRNNLLLAGDGYDDMELCGDLVGFFSAGSGCTGLVVWGEPWDADGWEITEAFAKRWGWTLKGCDDVFKSTNLWRASRGERGLQFDKLLQTVK